MQINAQIHTFNSQIRAETAKINRIVTATEAALSDRQRQYQDKKITTVAEFQEAQANLHSTRAALNAAKLKQKQFPTLLFSFQLYYLFTIAKADKKPSKPPPKHPQHHPA